MEKENTLELVQTSQTMRPYQDECITALRASWLNGGVPLAWMATGSGKGSIIAELLRREINPDTQRALVFAHTKEIIEQLVDRIGNQYGWSRIAGKLGMVMGENDVPDARIVVATRQSLHKKRLERVLQSGSFDMVIIDEGHHVSPDNTYHAIIRRLKEANPDTRFCGFSATPKRTDRKGLGVVFTDICFQWPIPVGIEQGWLSPATRMRIKTDVNASQVKTREGDYEQEALISLLDASNWVTLAIKAYKDYVSDRQTLAFFPQVAMSQKFVEELKAAGISAAHIDANTPKKERTEILHKYLLGEIKIVSNMAVLTEGFDAPQTQCILMARPTRSETLFTQVIGRGLRPFPGKEDCLILDLTVVDTKVLEVGTILGKMRQCKNCSAHVWSGLKICPQCGEALGAEELPKTRPCPRCGAEIPTSTRICPSCGFIIPRMIMPHKGKGKGETLETELTSLFHTLSSAWFKGSDGLFSVSVGFDGSAMVILPPTYAENANHLRLRIANGFTFLNQLSQDTNVNGRLDRLKRQIAMLQRELQRIDQYTLYYIPAILRGVDGRNLPDNRQPSVQPLRGNGDLSSLMCEADQEAKKYGGTQSSWKKDANWRGDPASPGQIKYLHALGARNLPEDLGKGEAAAQITHRVSAKRVKLFVEGDCLPEPKQEMTENAPTS